MNDTIRSLALLQVEDSESDAQLIVRLLENSGYAVHALRVETVPQMQAALEKQAWDAIIADYHLPQFDAPAALTVLQATALDIPFIVVSGAVGEDRAVAMMKAGAQDYVMKSSLARLAPAVEREIQEAKVRQQARQAAEALRKAHLETARSHQLLDAVFTAQTDCVLVCDPASVVIRTNPAASANLGFDPTGMTIPAVLEKLHIAVEPNASATERALSGEVILQLQQSAGDRTFETSSLPMRDTAGQIIGVVTVVRDITEKIRAEESIQEAQKLASIGLLAGGIAHDFNNILTVVNGSISLALEESCPICRANSTLPAALESLQRASALTLQLLAYAGKGACVRRPVSVSAAAEQSLATLRPSLNRELRIVTDLAPHLPPLLMDPGQLEQILSNLILNAAEAISAGQAGLVTIRTGVEEDSVFVEVSDDGCGMDAQTQKRIFDPFFTTKFPGRGLGLAAVDGIVRTLNGRIVVESAVGLGTRIKVMLPAVKAATSSHATAAAEIASKSYGAVLIVDDEPMVRKVAATFLKKRGIPVLEAATGKEAIERLASDEGAIRAILLDLEMPEMTGDAALPALCELRPDVRVIISSGFPGRDERLFPGEGAYRFLPKPYTSEQLLAEVLPAVCQDAREK